MTKEFLGRYFEYGGTLGNLNVNIGKYRGVYLIVCPQGFKITLNDHAALEKWREKIVALPKAELQQKLDSIRATPEILYIGKSERNVYKRMRNHCKFYDGKSVSAWGGRAISQIEEWRDLEVWYMECDNPYQTEKELLQTFKKLNFERPFANWRD